MNQKVYYIDAVKFNVKFLKDKKFPIAEMRVMSVIFFFADAYETIHYSVDFFRATDRTQWHHILGTLRNK